MTFTRTIRRVGILLAAAACLSTGVASAAVTPTEIQSMSTRVLVARDGATVEVRLRARLVSAGRALPGKTLVFSTEGREICSAITNSTGEAHCSTAQVVESLPFNGYGVSFAGDEDYGSASRASEGPFPIDGDVILVHFWIMDPDRGIAGFFVH